MAAASLVLLDSINSLIIGAHDLPAAIKTGKEPTTIINASVESNTLPPFPSETDIGIASSLPPQHTSYSTNNVVLPVCVTSSTSAHDSSHDPATPHLDDHNHIVPPLPIVPPIPRDSTAVSDSKPTTTATGQIDSEPASQTDKRNQSNTISTAVHSPFGEAPTAETREGRMIFGHQTPANVLQRRRNYANTNAVTDYEADLTSKDRAKQKEAVKKFLMDRLRHDWTWEWPRPEPRPDQFSPERALDQVDEVLLEGPWKERDEWLSNASESEGEHTIPATTSSPDTPSPTSKTSPFRFDSPEGVGVTIQKTQLERKRRRKQRLAEEVAWNDGLRCFVGRRNAWTGARRVPRSTSGFAGVKTAQRPSTSSETVDGGSSTAIEHENEEAEDEEWEDEIEIPVAPSLIPAENAMRASILPAAYGTIYDKVVVQALTPSCPMNLKDITRSCVQGWKRDGEWPPKPNIPEPKKKGRKLSIASLFGVEKHEKEAKETVKPSEKEKEKEGEKKAGSAIRKSLQKILSLGHGTKEQQVHTSIDHDGKGKPADIAKVS